MTTVAEGDVDTEEFAANSSTATVSVMTAGTTFNAGDGITLRVRSAAELATLEYRVGTDSSAKVGVTARTGPLPELTLSVENAQTFEDGEIVFTVEIDPAPATAVTIPIEAVDANDVAQTVSPTGGVVVNPATGGAMTSTATGRVSVADSGVTGPITIKVADSVRNYTFDPVSKSVDVPVEAAPTPIEVYLQATTPINEGDLATIRVETLALTLPTVDLTYGITVADLDGRNDSDGNRLDYIDEETYYVVLKAGQRNAMLEVQTKSIAGDADGLDGVLEATLESGVGYTPTGGAVHAEIRNGDATPDVLTVTGTTDSVVEGNDAIFNISREGTVGDLNFEYKVSGPTSIYSGTRDAIPGTISNGASFEPIMVPIVSDDALLSGQPNVRLTLQNSSQFKAATYRIATAADTIDVIDDAPVVSVKNYPANVTLGHSFTFTLAADPPPDMPLTVGLGYFPFPAGLFTVVDSNGMAITSAEIPTTGSVEVMVATNPLTTTTDQQFQTINVQARASGPNYIISRVAGENAVSFDLLNNQVADATRPRLALETYSTTPVEVTTTTSMLTFNILASHTPTADVDVNIELSQTGNFLSSSTISPVRLVKTAGVTTTPFTVDVRDDDGNTDAGEKTITVTLVDGTGYTLVSPGATPHDYTTEAKVTDGSALPEVSITAPMYALEGVPFTFTVSAPSLETGDSIDVSYTVADGDSNSYYGSHTPAMVTLTGDNKTGTVTVTTNKGGATSADGQIDIQITGGGTTYDAATSTPTSVTIQDEDLLPEVSIDLTSAATMEEGETAVFELTAGSPDPTADLMVNVNVAQSTGGGDFLNSEDASPAPVLVTMTDKTGTLRIRTDADTTVENDETITVTVQAATADANTGKVDYIVAGSNFSDLVTVQDNDFATGASITVSGADEVYEGGNVVFTFTTDTAPTGSDVFNVNYRITQVGDFLTTNDDTPALTGQVQIATDNTTATLAFETTADATEEGNGSFTAQVLGYTSEGTGLQYSVGEDAIQETRLLDDDDDDLPNVTIAADLASIIEGDASNADFTITSTAGTGSGNFRVNLLIAQSGNFIHANLLNDSNNYPNDDLSVSRNGDTQFQVQLANDNDEEVNGSITVSIVRDTGDTPVYSLGATTSATTIMIDNDATASKITIADDTDTEGNPGDNKTLTFDVSLSPVAMNPVTVDYTLGKAGDTAEITNDYTDATMRTDDDGNLIPAAGKLIFAAGDTTKTITIDIVEDTVEEPHETFTIVLSNATQGADITDSEATGTITNDDGLPEITLATRYANAVADSELEFTVSISPPPSGPIEVPVTASDGTNSSLVITPGSPISVGTGGSTTVRVSTLASSSGDLTLTLGSVAGYTSGAALTIPITSPTSPATLTITGPSAPVAEGGTATFTIAANPRADKDITVEVNVIDLVAKGTNFVENGIYYERLPANAASVPLVITTKTDTGAAVDGALVATLQDGAGYTHTSPSNEANAEIHDAENTTPVLVTVTPVTPSVEVGTDATFTFTRTGDLSSALPFSYELMETGEVTTVAEGDVDTEEFAANSSTATVSVMTAGTTFNAGDGITLRVRSAAELATLEYRVGTDSSAKVGVTARTGPLPELTLSVENAQTFEDGEIVFTVEIDPAPATAVTIPIEAVDANDVAQTVSPTGGVVVNPATGGAMTSTATGRVSVADSGVTGPITIKVADSVRNYTFDPVSKSVDVPVEAAPTPIEVYLQATTPINEGDLATIRVETLALTLPTVDLTYGITVADLDGRNDSDGNRLDYIDEETYYVVLKAGQRNAMLEVQTKSIAGDADGLDGVLEATLESGVGYTPTGGAVHAEIRNGDATPDVLTVTGTTDSVVEGNDAIFNISREGTVGDLNFEYKVSGPTSIYSGTRDAIPGTISNGASFEPIMVPIVSDDALLSGQPNVRLTLQNSSQFKAATYRIATAADTIDVIDDAPVVSVKNYPANVTLGHSFTFTLAADPPPDMPLTVGLGYFPFPAGLFTVVDSNGMAITSAEIPTTGSVEVMVATNPLTTTTDQQFQTINVQARASGPNYIISRVAGENAVSFDLLNNQVADATRPRLALETYSTTPVEVTTTTSMLTFNILASHTPTADVDVNIELSQTGNFLSSSTISPVRLVKTAGVTTTPFTVDVRDDDGNTDAGEKTITVTLVDGTGYTLVSPGATPHDYTTEAKVTDGSALPEVSITAPMYALEGVPFTFTVSAPSLETGDSIDVSYTVADGDSNSYYGSHTPAMVTLTGDNKTGTVTVTTNKGGATSADGQIDIQITGGGTTYDAATSTPTSVTIQDEDLLPEVSIDLTSAATMEEGETAVFELTAGSPDPTADLMVNVNVAQSTGGGDFLNSEDASPAPVLVTMTDKTGTLRIRTDADTTVENDETITVTVQAATADANTGKVDYIVAGSNFSDLVTVQDNDFATGASITVSGADEVYEGGNVVFTFTTDTAPTGSDVFNVNYRITQVGDFLTTNDDTPALTGQVQIATDNTTATLAFETTADATEEGNGSFTAQVLGYTSEGTGLQYSVGEDAIQETRLLDDDDDDLPNVTIAADLASIIEGDASNADFTITSTAGTGSGNFRVNLLIAQSGNFIHANLLNDSNNYPNDDLSVSRNGDTQFQVQLANDNDEEVNGSITVSIVRDTGDTPVYSLGATTSATTIMIDNDATASKITIADDTDTEGNPGDNKTLTFDVSLSPVAMNPVTVDYTLGKAGDTAEITNDYTDATMRTDDDGNLIPAAGKLIFAAGDTTKTITIDIVEDTVEEPHETFTIVLSNATQGADITDSEATGTITNDDGLPEITLATRYANAVADSELEFTVSISPPPSGPIEVPVTASDGTNSSLVITPGSPISVGTGGSTTVRVSTLASSSGDLTLTLGSVAGYTSGAALTIPITSPTSPATLTITGPSAPVAEGGTATFTIAANPRADKDITVEVNVIDLVAKGTNFVENGIYYERLPANAASVPLVITTKTDTGAAVDGALVATLQDGAGYTHTSPSNEANAEIHDAENTTPVLVTVTPVTPSVEVGTDATFTFTRTGDLSSALPFSYELMETGEVTTVAEGDVDTEEFAANSSTATVSVMTAGTTFNAGDGITLRVRSAAELATLEYRVGTDSSAKVGVTARTGPLPELTLSVENAQTFEDGEIVFTVEIDPAPATAVTIPIEAVDANDVAQTVSPTGGVVVNPATGGAMTSTATGRVSVADSGVTGPITIKVADSVRNYTFDPVSKSVDVPVEAAPTPIEVYLQATTPINEGDLATIRVETLALTLPTVDLTYGITVADLDGRNDSDGNRLDYIDEETYYVVLKAGQRNAMLEVQTKSIAGDADGLDGVLEATLESGVGYTPTGGAVHAEIRNGDATPDVLTVTGTTDSVVEGNDAIFNISREGTVGDLNFEYKVSGPTSIYSGTRDAIPGTISNGASFEPIMVPIVSDDALLSGQPNVRLTLQNSSQFKAATYRIATAADTIDVIDDAPVVSVKNYPANVTLGHSFTFTLAADPPPDMPLTVGLGYFPFPAGLFTVVDSNGMAITSAEIPTTGSVEVMVATNPLTTTTDQQFQTINVQARASGPNYIISRVAGENAVSFDLLNNQVADATRPRLALETYSTTPVEVTTTTSMLTFNILASHTPTADVDVNIELSQTGNFLSSSTISPVRLVKTAGVTTTPFTVDVRDDDGNTDAGEKTITVTLVDGTGYTLVSPGATPHDYTTEAKVTDGSALPEVSITAPMYALEGVPFTFTVSAPSLETGDSIDVSYTVADGDSNSYYGSHTPAMVTLTGDNKTGTVTVTTNKGGATSADGQIDIQITGGGTTYDAATSTPTSVTIQDEDLLPEVSIDLTSAATMEEGETAVFELTAGSPDPTADLMVNVMLRNQLVGEIS